MNADEDPWKSSYSRQEIPRARRVPPTQEPILLPAPKPPRPPTAELKLANNTLEAITCQNQGGMPWLQDGYNCCTKPYTKCDCQKYHPELKTVKLCIRKERR